jgi:primary-amine oxidase
MIVPYGDPDRFYQSPLDIGEFNIGTMTNSLELGCDCLGLIHYFDVAYAAPDGTPMVVRNGICMHEEDFGILWKHTDFRTGHVEVRRSRRLVISTIATVGNYDYGFFWYLYQDGTIAGEVKATGIVATKALQKGEEPEYGQLVAPRLAGTNHQHSFCVRLDFDIDGSDNTVYEVESVSEPRGPSNPHGNAWKTVERPLRTESEGKRDIDAATARTWLIRNPSQRNSVDRPVAFRLVPGDNTSAFCTDDSYQRTRASFVDHHLWITPYSPTERYPAGDYPYQHSGGAGLAEWTSQDRAIENRDIVVWYTMIHHHVPRPEDWPVMPVARIGFELRPVGFFDRNPSLDVPPPTAACH